jgi:hypothetical protein
MRNATLAVVFAAFGYVSSAFGELTAFENTCAELGFKRKTPAYGECVLELRDRSLKQAEIAQAEAVRQAEVTRQKEIATAGDGTPDHKLCNDFGFVYGTQQYADCRLRISVARKEEGRRKAEYELAVRQYEQEKAAYDARLAEYEREKERQRSLAMARFGFALAAGQSPSLLENLGNAGRVSAGLAPVAPARPQIQNFTITGPSGRMTNCNVIGSNINCF